MKEVERIGTPPYDVMMEFEQRLIVPVKAPDDDKTTFKTKSGLEVATGYHKVVIGEEGPRIEFDLWHLANLGPTFEIPADQEWRQKDPLTSYVEWRTTDGVEMRQQVKRVPYADYDVGCYYMDPVDLYVDGKQVLPNLPNGEPNWGSEWLHEEDYDKDMYEVLAEDDEIVPCWPNASKWNEVNVNDPRHWVVGSIRVRKQPRYPEGLQWVKKYNRAMREDDCDSDAQMFLCGYCGEMTRVEELQWNEDRQGYVCKLCNVY